MKFQKLLKSSFLGKRNSDMATVALIGGIAVGAALGVLFATKKGKETKSKIISLFANLTGRSVKLNKSNELGNLVENVRGHVKQNAEGLLGKESTRKNTAAVVADNVPSNKWKEQKEKTNFPNDANPKIINN